MARYHSRGVAAPSAQEQETGVDRPRVSALVVHDPVILENGLVVPRQFQSGRASRVVGAIEPKDPEKPVIIEAKPNGDGSGNIVGAAMSLRGHITEMNFDRSAIWGGMYETKVDLSIQLTQDGYHQMAGGFDGEVDIFIVPRNTQDARPRGPNVRFIERPGSTRYFGSTIPLNWYSRGTVWPADAGYVRWGDENLTTFGSVVTYDTTWTSADTVTPERRAGGGS